MLADIFEASRNNSLKSYESCLNHYLRVPALSSDAKLKMTKVRFKFIPDSDMYLFFKNGMIGRFSYISERYSKANISVWNIMIQNKNQNILYT